MTVKRNLLTNVCVFCCLVLVGVAGRLYEPTWCFTPLAAIALFAGYFFANRCAALLVPLTAMVVSDLCLPAYAHLGVQIAVYGALVAPVVMGWALRRKISPLRLTACGLLPAVIFFLTTNFAVWLVDGLYPTTMTGLLNCYLAAVPFFRVMLAGDALYVTLIFGSYALATRYGGVMLRDARRRPETARA